MPKFPRIIRFFGFKVKFVRKVFIYNYYLLSFCGFVPMVFSLENPTETFDDPL